MSGEWQFSGGDFGGSDFPTEFEYGKKEVKCSPASCRCCECQNKHCLVWHPGHSHKTHDFGLAKIKKGEGNE